MHELSIVDDMFRIILEVARQEGMVRIDKVHFQIGRMMHIVPDQFRFAFGAARKHTIAEQADLEIEWLDIKMRCRQCGLEFFIKESAYKCNYCGGKDLDLLQGKELFIKSIEGA